MKLTGLQHVLQGQMLTVLRIPTLLALQQTCQAMSRLVDDDMVQLWIKAAKQAGVQVYYQTPHQMFQP